MPKRNVPVHGTLMISRYFGVHSGPCRSSGTAPGNCTSESQYDVVPYSARDTTCRSATYRVMVLLSRYFDFGVHSGHGRNSGTAIGAGVNSKVACQACTAHSGIALQDSSRSDDDLHCTIHCTVEDVIVNFANHIGKSVRCRTVLCT